MEVIKQGAEAVLYLTQWKGRKAVLKKRVKKSYRHPELDTYIRKHRVKEESMLLAAAKEAGVRTPYIYDIDMKEYSITMEYIEGKLLVEYPDESTSESLGRCVALLHRAGIVHGDLTCANVLVSESIVLIDFGLGFRNPRIEDMGMDLHVLEESYKALGMEELFKHVLNGYISEGGKKDAINVMKDIARRGRYVQRRPNI